MAHTSRRRASTSACVNGSTTCLERVAMTLLSPDVEANIVTDKPRLHALVIGVADYPHLMNGSGALAGDPLGLGQVTTPQYTACLLYTSDAADERSSVD